MKNASNGNVKTIDIHVTIDIDVDISAALEAEQASSVSRLNNGSLSGFVL